MPGFTPPVPDASVLPDVPVPDWVPEPLLGGLVVVVPEVVPDPVPPGVIMTVAPDPLVPL